MRAPRLSVRGYSRTVRSSSRTMRTGQPSSGPSVRSYRIAPAALRSRSTCAGGAAGSGPAGTPRSGAHVSAGLRGGAAETAARHRRRAARCSGEPGRRERGRLVAPVLAEGVGEQAVGDRPPAAASCRRRVFTQAWSMFQSSVISWSSKIISDGTFASTRRTCGQRRAEQPDVDAAPRPTTPC